MTNLPAIAVTAFMAFDLVLLVLDRTTNLNHKFIIKLCIAFMIGLVLFTILQLVSNQIVQWTNICLIAAIGTEFIMYLRNAFKTQK